MTAATGSGVTEHPGNSSANLLSVEWIGNVIQVLDQKFFCQTCCIAGVMYKLQDHVLL